VPTYGYRCSRGHHFEIFQRISDAPLEVCPECGAPVTRVFYPVGIVFKGQGFYKTDSRGAESSAVSSDGAGKKSESKSETKSDSSSTPKKETKTETAGTN
jgi:putative FmdB family regulatory protein